jgi:hypothetical protein
LRTKLIFISFLRTRNLIVGCIITALVGSVFLGIYTITVQASDIIQDLNSKISNSNSKSIQYSLYYYNSSICIIKLNESELKYFANVPLNSSELLASSSLISKLNLKDRIMISNRSYSLVESNNLPSILGDCLISNSIVNSTKLIGNGTLNLGYPSPNEFLSLISNSLNEISLNWIYLGYFSIAVFSAIFSYLTIRERKEDLRALYEQGTDKNSIYTAYIYSCLVFSILTILLSQTFNLVIQNISIGIINDLLGYVPFYSRFDLSIFQSLYYGIISFLSQLAFSLKLASLFS